MIPKESWLKENFDKLLLAFLLTATILGTVYAEHHFKDDGVYVGFWMGLAQNFQGAIIAVITGKVMAGIKSKETVTEGGTINNLNLVPAVETPADTKGSL